MGGAAKTQPNSQKLPWRSRAMLPSGSSKPRRCSRMLDRGSRAVEWMWYRFHREGLAMHRRLGLFMGIGALAACGSTDQNEPKSMAGASAAGTSASAAGTSGTAGGASGGAATAGSPSAGSAALAPSGGSSAGGASVAPLPTQADVDLTLGGLNQDLAPTPSTCDVPGGLGCISVSGEVGGKKFSATCQNNDGISGSVRVAGTSRFRLQLHCSPQVTGNDFTGFVLYIYLDDYLGAPTRLFSYQSPDDQVPTAGESISLFWLEPTGFRSYEQEPSATTHDEVVKIAGLNYEEAYASKDKLSKFVFGAFAASWTPRASCLDCQLVRLYARFNVVYEL